MLALLLRVDLLSPLLVLRRALQRLKIVSAPTFCADGHGFVGVYLTLHLNPPTTTAFLGEEE